MMHRRWHVLLSPGSHHEQQIRPKNRRVPMKREMIKQTVTGPGCLVNCENARLGPLARVPWQG
jgi:hypothetical protein